MVIFGYIWLRLTSFVLGILLYLASLKLSRGWLAGWVVGNSDFNENPVVSLDLDFDLGFVNTRKVSSVMGKWMNNSKK